MEVGGGPLEAVVLSVAKMGGGTGSVCTRDADSSRVARGSTCADVETFSSSRCVVTYRGAHCMIAVSKRPINHYL